MTTNSLTDNQKNAILCFSLGENCLIYALLATATEALLLQTHFRNRVSTMTWKCVRDPTAGPTVWPHAEHRALEEGLCYGIQVAPSGNRFFPSSSVLPTGVTWSLPCSLKRPWSPWVLASHLPASYIGTLQPFPTWTTQSPSLKGPNGKCSRVWQVCFSQYKKSMPCLPCQPTYELSHWIPCSVFPYTSRLMKIPQPTP